MTDPYISRELREACELAIRQLLEIIQDPNTPREVMIAAAVALTSDRPFRKMPTMH